MAVLLGVIAVGDSPALFPRTRQQIMVLDRAVTDEAAARDLLGPLLGARIDRVSLRKVDLVTESTVCDVRFTLPAIGREVPDSPDARISSASNRTPADVASASIR
nr:DUF4956 domain-containing protein [Aeromicrobium sp. A1-2]